MITTIKKNVSDSWNYTRPFRPVLIIVIVLFVLFSVWQPGFRTLLNVQNVISSISIMWIIAMAMTFVLISGGFDLSVGAIAAFCGIFLGKVLEAQIMPGPLALIATILLGALLGGLFNGVFVAIFRLSVFVVTLASMTAITGMVLVWTETQSIYVTDPVINLISIDRLFGIQTPIYIMIAVFIVFLFLQERTYFGRDIYATGGSYVAARLSGIRTERTLIMVYAVTGACSGLAGAIAVGRVGAATPQVDPGIALQAVAAVLIGGTTLGGGSGSIVGTALGCLFIGILQNGLNMIGVVSSWQYVVTGIILLASVLGNRASGRRGGLFIGLKKLLGIRSGAPEPICSDEPAKSDKINEHESDKKPKQLQNKLGGKFIMKNQFKDPDLGKDPGQLFNERNTRVLTALQLQQPDRIPIMMLMSYMLADMYGATHQEQQDNKDKEQEMLEKAGAYFQPDIIWGVFNDPCSGTTLALNDISTRFPGHSGLDPNGSYQFVEDEYMKPEEWDDFINDPADWAIRKYWPRVFKELEGLAMLPPLGMAAFGCYSISNISFIKIPPIASALKALAKAADAQAETTARAQETVGKMISLGFAPFPLAGALVEAPFDLIGDMLRGMKGMMLDLFRRPEKILAAVEKVLKFELEHAITFCKATGLNAAFIPLHRGSDGFMSLPQFEKFYWPTLKALILGLVEAGISVGCFYEGIWDERLEYLTELPKGKTCGWFQKSDIFKVKEIVGDTMAIIGGMPNNLLQAGTPEEVRDFTIEVCKKVGKGGGFIMSTTVGEMEGCKPELVKVWVDTTKEYGVYS